MRNKKLPLTKNILKAKPFSVSDKSLLEQAVQKAVKTYLDQEQVLKKNKVKFKIKEESLRYLIVNELSKIKIFGDFPAKNPEKFILIQHTYNSLKRGKSYQYPDIATLGKNTKGDYNYYLAVEIKNNKKNDNYKDLNKCFGYVSEEKGSEMYQLALCVNFTGKSLVKETYKSNKSKGNVLFTTVENYGDSSQQKIVHIWCKKNSTTEKSTS
jgi:hypothetical protein